MSGIDFLDAPVRQARTVDAASRRPWPLPGEPWAQGQTAHDVLFAHWRANADELGRFLPPELTLHLFAGVAWVGIVVSRVTALRLRGLPPLLTRAHGTSLAARYRGRGKAVAAEPGTLEHFLSERYCLYTADGGSLFRAETHQPPWRLQRAAGTIEAEGFAPAALAGDPHLAYCARQDSVSWALEAL